MHAKFLFFSCQIMVRSSSVNKGIPRALVARNNLPITALISCGVKLGPQVWHLALVVQKLDSAFHRINHYPKDEYYENLLRFPLDSDLSSGECYTPFEQLGPEVACHLLVSCGCLDCKFIRLGHTQHSHFLSLCCLKSCEVVFVLFKITLGQAIHRHGVYSGNFYALFQTNFIGTTEIG